MTEPVEIEDLLPDPDFREVHRRVVDLPVDVVWDAAMTVLTKELRLLGPLMAIRNLPSRVRRGTRRGSAPDRSMLDELEAMGFLRVREDTSPVAGRAVVLHCAAGRFWSLSDDAAIPLASIEEFTAHRLPGTARVVTSVEALDRGEHTELITETRISGTDAAAHQTFRRYWMVIRLPSGIIRRSWLAAIDRRAKRSSVSHRDPMVRWAGRLITLFGLAHTLGALTVEGAARHAPAWFRGDLWGNDLSAMSPPMSAYWLSIDSFGVPLVLLGLTVLHLDRHGMTPPPFIAWALAAWTVVDLVALGPLQPQGWLFLGTCALLATGAARATRTGRLRGGHR